MRPRRQGPAVRRYHALRRHQGLLERLQPQQERLTRHWHHLALTVWLLVCVAVYGRHGGQSWHFLVTGARSLFCAEGLPGNGIACGLHVYAQHPDIQIGPLSLLVAAPAVLAQGSDGFTIARVAMASAGLLSILLVERAAPARLEADVARRRWRVFLGGLAFLPAWADLSVGFGHLDDVLALVFTAAAVHAIAAGRPRSAGWWLALAVVCKPWAIAFLPLLLALPRNQWRAALTRAVLPVVALVGLFLVADPASIRAAQFRIANADASSLRLFGVTEQTPSWDRPMQFALGWLLGGAAVRFGRWRAVIMIAAAARIMLDPQVYSYYSAGVLLGTLVWDVQERRGRVVPLWTWATFGALFGSRYLPLSAGTLGGLRLAICLVLIVCAVWAPGLLAHVIPPRRHRNALVDGEIGELGEIRSEAESSESSEAPSAPPSRAPACESAPRRSARR